MPRFLLLAIRIVLPLLLVAGSVRADDVPICAGVNLLTRYQSEKPDDAAKLMAEVAAIPNQGPLFWKITGPKGVKPSWLLGTVHVSDARVTQLSPDMQARLKAAHVLVLELKEIANRGTLGMSMLAFLPKMQMPEGQTLWDVIPDDKEAVIKANPVIKKVPEALLSKFQPWVLSTMFAVPPCEEERKASKFTLDETLAQQAQIYNVTIAGLETVEEQVNVMAGMSLPMQVEQLVMATRPDIPSQDIFATMIELYLKRQVSVLIPLAKRIMPAAATGGAADFFMSDVLDKRNVTMAQRAAPFIDAGNAFIAVGALHLAGEKGVIALLQKAGYQLTPAE